NGENRRHWFNVRNPETEQVGRLEFETEISNDPFCETHHPDAQLVVTLHESTGRWFTEPNNQSRMTFKPDAVTKQMAMLRLDFADLDMFEAVWGLTPWPDKIVDASNNEPRMVDNEADALLYVDSATEIPETFLVYPELGAIRARENNLVVHAYYNTIPEEISYRYHNFRNGKSCHIPEFTGYALQEGPCCNGCEDDIDVGCETFILMDQRQDGTEQFFLRKICKDVDGNVTVEDLMLDGETEYVVDGTPLSPEAFRDNCSATVFTREMWDLTPGDLASNIVTQKQCATTFLRHYVYDCDGKIKEVYDTTSDGLTPYEPVRPIEA